jgi:class 3 adenylate cyclase
MWSLTITNPKSEPMQIKLTPGKMSIGRAVTSDIVINDMAASRRHAEIYFDPMSEVLRIIDLKSSNGTYVNRQKITGYYRLQNGDVIRIGQIEMHLTKITDSDAVQKGISGTHLFTRELVLESVDEYPIQLNEISEKLNIVDSLDSAISLVTDQVKRSLGADICEIVLAKNFNLIKGDGADNLKARVIRKSSIETSPFAMCIPVLSGEKPLALIYLERNRQGVTPFEKRDLQLVVAISHLTAMTMVRMELIEKIRKEGQVKQLLLRFVSPIEAEDLLKDYFGTGNLPNPAEKKVTILFVEITDSTEITKRIGLAKFSSILNAFYQYATQAVFKKRGIVKLLGDGALAVFLEKTDASGSEERAISVGQDIIEFVKRTNPLEPDQPLTVGVTVHTGIAMVGYFGTLERAEFNVMGDLIKTVYRMQDYALPNRILIGELTADAIHNNYLLHKIGNLKILDCESPFQIYEVSLEKISPFVQLENDMSEAFKAVAEKLRARKA